MRNWGAGEGACAAAPVPVPSASVAHTTVTARFINASPGSVMVPVSPAAAGGDDQKMLPSFKLRFQPGMGRPAMTHRSDPYAQSSPLLPGGEIRLPPTPVPQDK